MCKCSCSGLRSYELVDVFFSDLTLADDRLNAENQWMIDMSERCEPLPDRTVLQGYAPMGLNSLVIVGGHIQYEDTYKKNLYRFVVVKVGAR